MLLKYPLPAIMTPLLVIPVSTEKIKSFAIAADTVVNIAPRILSSSCYVSCFTVSVTPSINTLESSNDFMILIYHSYLHLKSTE